MAREGRRAGFVSVELIAERLNLTPRRVQQLSAEGVLPKSADGLYDLIGCYEGYIRYLQVRVYGRDTLGEDAQHHKTRLLKAQADERELEVARRLGLVVDIEAAAGLLTGVIGASRAKLLALPTKLAPQMIGVESAREVRALLEEEIHGALNELAELDLASLGGGEGARAVAPTPAAAG